MAKTDPVRRVDLYNTGQSARGGSTTVVGGTSVPSTLVIGTDDGEEAVPNSNSELTLAGGTGLETSASGNLVTIDHSTGDAGDLHTNYAEHDAEETISANWLFGTDKKLQFRDSDIFIQSSGDGQLDIDADGEIELTAPTIDVHGDIMVSALSRLYFRDSALFVYSSGDGQLDLDADGEIELASPTIELAAGIRVHISGGPLDLNGNLEFQGARSITSTSGNLTLAPAENLIVDKDTGLGTSSPRRALDVLDNAAPQIRLTHTDNSVYTDLKTTGDGYFLIEPSGGRMQLDLDLEFIGSQKILTSLDSLILEPADQLHLNPLGDEVIFTNWGAGKAFESDDYASQTTGFSIAYGSTGGHCDFRSGYFDELHVKAFIAEIYEAFVGGIVVTKSKGRLSRDFVIPANAATGTLYVEDLEGWEGVQLFQDGDYVLLRHIDMSGGGLIVADVWGSVVFVQDEGGGEQSYTWTTTDDGDVDGSSVYRGAVALDYGQPASGSRGVWEATVLDQAGAPYSQVKTWETNPWTAGNWTVRTRLGNLDGISGIGLEYGLWAGQGTGSDDQYFIMSDAQADLHNMPMTFHDGTNTRIKLEPLVSEGGPYISVGNTAPSSYLGGDGFWVGNDSGTYKAFLGDADGERMQWDGDEFGIYAATGDPLFITGPAGNWMSSLMVSESMGQWIFSQNNGLALWGPGCEISPSTWVSTRGQQAAITGAFRTGPGAWANTRALQVAQYTVNKVLNPNLGGTYSSGIAPSWSKGGTAASLTCTESTAYKVFGEKCQKLEFAPGATNPYFYTTPDGMAYNTEYTWQVWLYVESFDTGVRVRFGKGDGYNNHDITTTGMHYVTTTATTAASGSLFLILVSALGGNAVVYLLGAQCEGGPDATPLAAGDMGSGYSFTGTPYESTTIRQATNVSADMGAFSPTAGTIAIRCKQHAKRATNSYLCRPGDGTAMDIFQASADNSIAFRIAGITRCSIPGGDWNAGEELDLIFTYDVAGNESKAYLNGELKATGTCPSFTPGTSFQIGGLGSGDYQWNGWISQFATLGAVLTADQVAAMYATRRPLVDAGAVTNPGLYILDGKVRIASSTTGNRLDLNNYSLAIGNGVTYNSGTGVWLGLDGGTTPKMFLGDSAADKMTWDGSSLDITGNVTADSGAIAGWTMISNALYKLDSGTPTSTPNNGITLQTVGGTNSKPVIKVYDGTTMNAALGNYASGKYGIYAQEGSIGGWTINATDIYNTHMGMESDNERLWIHNSTFANAGIQLEYNGGSPRAHIGNGSTEYFKYTGSALDILTGGGALRFNSVGFQFKLGGLYTGDGASGIGVVWKTVFDDVTPANEKTQGYIRMVPQISPNKPYLELVSGSADNNYYCNIAMRTVTDSGTRTPIFIDGDAQRVSIYDTTPADATFSVLNPGNNEPTCSFQQIASDKAVLHLKHTHANVYYFNFEGGHTDRDGYNAVRVYLQGVGTRWLRLYDTDA